MSNRLSVRELDATGYVGDGARALFDDGSWKVPAGGSGGAGSGAIGRMVRNTDQAAIPANTATKVTFTTSTVDTGGVVDLPNSRFIAPAAGTYLFSHVINLGTEVPTAYSYLYVNGSPMASTNSLPLARVSNGSCLVAAFPALLAAGDVLEVYVVSSASTAIRGTFPSWAELAGLGGNGGAGAGVGVVDGGTWDSTYTDFIDGGSL